MRRLKAVAVFLGLLAAAKVGTQEYLFRDAIKEVLVSAYRERAAAACQKDLRSQGPAGSGNAWARSSDVRVVIGRSDLDVWPWQVDNALWNARYRNPYLYLSPSDRNAGLQCEYDIVNGIASLTRI